MRIIGGNFRGKKLLLPKDKTTRPLKDLTKESIFNIISHSKKIKIDIQNSFILDTFSGSGSFGIECISRGAKKVFFLEKYIEAIKVLEKNLLSLKKVDNYEIFKNDFFLFFNSTKNFKVKFNLIIIDPPYKEEMINQILEIILNRKMLKNNGIIIIHRHINDNIKILSKFNIIEERNYGISKILFGN